MAGVATNTQCVFEKINDKYKKKRHPQRSQRLGYRSRQPKIHSRFAFKHHKRKRANGRDCGWATGGEV
jgi:hypothetical protein